MKAAAPRTREQVSAQARADRPGLPRPALHPGNSVLLKNLQPQALEPRWTGLHAVILTAPTAAKLLGDPSLMTCPGTASPGSRGPRSNMTSINVRCWAPLRSALTALPFSFLLPALSNLHPPPPAYVWRFKVRETYYQNGKQVTWQQNPDRCNQDVNTYGVATGETAYHTAASLTKASPGTFFWCNGTLRNCMNSSDPGPCFVVTVVPQLTLYGESELTGCSLHPIPGPAGLPSSLSC
ncbi:uncharacterized protein LOC132229576 [Myotis daubentonii]|uniref:uncharacterized protein LOC132229576 n=1 Tax=Myotis daubentonii TaxID=98922 RepID=UPI002873E95B|nr:uncharacterized protein LOC132229576 [Myotis daubentonii]